jgi:hypothetical protein
VKYNQDTLEDFIRENRDKFNVSQPSKKHLDSFMTKFNRRIRHLINIVPYLLRVFIATILIFSVSILIWNNFLRKDRHEVSLKNKITWTIRRFNP